MVLLALAVALLCGTALAVEYPCEWSAGYAGNPDSELLVSPAEWVGIWQDCDPGYYGEYVIEEDQGYRYVSLVDYGPGGNSPWKDYQFLWPWSWQFQTDMATGEALFDGDPGDWCILEFGGGMWYDREVGQYFDPTPERIKFTVVPEPAVVSSLAGLALALGGILRVRLR
jgi:hypothetical protein